MAFKSPKPSEKISVEDKEALLAEYLAYYANTAKSDLPELRRKLPRAVFQPFLDEIGEHVLKLAKEIENGSANAKGGNVVKQFLEANPIPGKIGRNLTIELRAYAVLIRAVLQWAVGQSLAIDRWVISGNARKTLRASSPRCIVTGEPFGDEKIELHHPMRDGRPPLPVSAKGHKIADDVFDPQDELGKSLVKIRRMRSYSWRLIWQGCLVELGEAVDLAEYGKNRSRAAAAAARWFSKQAKISVQDIRAWIEENELLDTVA